MDVNGLNDFFQVMNGFLTGKQELSDSLRRLGHSPSSDEQFQWYRQMVRTNADRLLASVYDIVQIHAGDEVFKRCCQFHLASKDTFHWDIARLALDFASSVDMLCDEDPSIPITVAYLADWEELLFQLRTFAVAPMDRNGLNPTVEVRQYTHDVRGYRRAIRNNQAKAQMEERPVTYVAFRHDQTSRIQVFVPTLPQLLLIAWAKKELETDDIQDVEFPDGAMEEALTELQKKTVLGETFRGPQL